MSLLTLARYRILLGYPCLKENVYFSTSCPVMYQWKKINCNNEMYPDTYERLSQLPDYSFVDGRPVPLGMNRYKRMKLQQEYCEKIMQLNSEIDFAVELHKKRLEEQKQNEEEFEKLILKEKGNKYKRK